jgi:hypothetical protein
MKARTAVVDWSGNYEENCIQLGRHLGRDKMRRKLFDAIYGRSSKPRSKKQLMKATGLKVKHGQQAQNQLDHLSRYGLILRDDNDGSVSDGSRYVYSKEPNVRAYRARIVMHADKPSLAKTTPTKRNPIVRRSLQVQHTVVTRQALKKRKHLDVLYLTANPAVRKSLRVDAEVRQVQEAIRGSLLRDNISLHVSPAADLDSIMNGLNDSSPRIVHFSGHGYSGGIAVDHAQVKRPKGKVVAFDLLGKAFAAIDNPPEVVVLNACESAGARKALLSRIKVVIAMNASISDVAATAFAAKFYAGIAAGQSLQSAFRQGQVAVEAVSIHEVNTPEMIVATGANPSKIYLA